MSLVVMETDMAAMLASAAELDPFIFGRIPEAIGVDGLRGAFLLGYPAHKKRTNGI